MHTNYRRKNVFRGKHHNRRAWPLAPSLTWEKALHHRCRRRRVAELIAHGRYDDIVDRDPRRLLYDFW